MAVAVVALTREQKAIFEAMPKAWQTETKQAMAIQASIVRTGVMGRYDLGEIVAKFTKNEANYGEEAVPNLAAVLDEDPNNLWQYRQFVGSYKRSEVEALLERSRKAGYRMTWSHFDALSGIAGSKALVIRKTLEQACLVDRLTVVELRDRVQKKMGGKRSQGGRPAMKPRSILAGIGQMNKLAEQYENRWGGWEEVVFDGMTTAGVDQVNQDLLQSLEGGRAAQEHLRELAATAVAAYDSAIARATSVIGEQSAEPTAEDPAVPEDAGTEYPPDDYEVAEAPPAVQPAVAKKKPLPVKPGSVADRVSTARAKRPQPA